MRLSRIHGVVLALAAISGAVAPILALCARAHAQAPVRVRLEYQRDEGGIVCPDATAIEVGVAARLGYDPFAENAADLVRVAIRPSVQGLEARIEMLDSGGKLKAERRLLSRHRDCKELASSVELAISIAVDPSGVGAAPASGLGAAPAPAPASAPPSEPVPAPTVSAAVEPEPRHPLVGDVTAMAVGGLHSAPSPSLGIGLGASLGGQFLSLGIEGRADLPSSRSLRAGSVSASLLTASLVPCAHGTYLGFCALATAGVLHAAGHGLVDARQVNFFYAAVGARVAFAYPVGPRWSLAAHADAVSPLTETNLQVDGETVWSSSTIVFALGLGATVKIP